MDAVTNSWQIVCGNVYYNSILGSVFIKYYICTLREINVIYGQ